MKTIVFIILVLAVVYLAFRFWPDDRDRWHVDPADTEDERRAEVRLIGLDAPRFSADAEQVLQTIADIAAAEPRTKLLDGSVAEGSMTFISRSRFGFRDYITVKAVAEGDATKLAILSRPRIDGQDWGVNAARMDRWILEAGQLLGGAS